MRNFKVSVRCNDGHVVSGVFNVPDEVQDHLVDSYLLQSGALDHLIRLDIREVVDLQRSHAHIS